MSEYNQEPVMAEPLMSESEAPDLALPELEAECLVTKSGRAGGISSDVFDIDPDIDKIITDFSTRDAAESGGDYAESGPVLPDVGLAKDISETPNPSEDDQLREIIKEAESPTMANEKLTEVFTAIEGMTAEIEKLTKAVDRFHERSKASEETVKKMHARIDQLESEQIRLYTKPVIRKIARLHAQLALPRPRMVKAGASDTEPTVYWDASDLQHAADEVEDILDSMDIESVDAKVGDLYSPDKHFAKRVIDTDDSSQDKVIARVLTQGFKDIDADRVFLPADVEIFKLVPNAEAAL